MVTWSHGYIGKSAKAVEALKRGKVGKSDARNASVINYQPSTINYNAC